LYVEFFGILVHVGAGNRVLVSVCTVSTVENTAVRWVTVVFLPVKMVVVD
jgi:hypothetical protein